MANPGNFVNSLAKAFDANVQKHWKDHGGNTMDIGKNVISLSRENVNDINQVDIELEALSQQVDRAIELQEEVISKLNEVANDVIRVEKEVELFHVEKEEEDIGSVSASVDVTRLQQDMRAVIRKVCEVIGRQIKRIEAMERMTVGMQPVICLIGDILKNPKFLQFLMQECTAKVSTEDAKDQACQTVGQLSSKIKIEKVKKEKHFKKLNLKSYSGRWKKITKEKGIGKDAPIKRTLTPKENPADQPMTSRESLIDLQSLHAVETSPEIVDTRSTCGSSDQVIERGEEKMESSHCDSLGAETTATSMELKDDGGQQHSAEGEGTTTLQQISMEEKHSTKGIGKETVKETENDDTDSETEAESETDVKQDETDTTCSASGTDSEPRQLDTEVAMKTEMQTIPDDLGVTRRRRSLVCCEDTKVEGTKEEALSLNEDDETLREVVETTTPPQAPFEHRIVSTQVVNVNTFFAVNRSELLGGGRFGQVHPCVEKATSLTLAAKIIRARGTKEKDMVRNEINIMNELNHTNLIRLYDAYESNNDITLIMEYLEGGELFDRIVSESERLTELECMIFVQQICEGVQYIHQNYILHLDLKPENIVCVNRHGKQVKIIDFGLARRFKPREKLKVIFGTAEFLAPEVVNYEFVSFPTDMWSVGIITYMLLSSLSPFLGDDEPETMSNIASGEWEFEEKAFKNVSEEAKDFISSLLEKEKAWRMSAKSALAHKWLSKASFQQQLKKTKSTEDKRTPSKKSTK
uniref:myosin light chain kinase 3-like isoform X2 n=1 Tax=Myxine glutinosa TaxID=7769 RepID=UPI00358F7604